MYFVDAVDSAVVSDADTLLVLLENQLVPIDLPTCQEAPVAAELVVVAAEPNHSNGDKMNLVKSTVIEHC